MYFIIIIIRFCQWWTKYTSSRSNVTSQQVKDAPSKFSLRYRTVVLALNDTRAIKKYIFCFVNDTADLF